jgi:hypothetical protein
MTRLSASVIAAVLLAACTQPTAPTAAGGPELAQDLAERTQTFHFDDQFELVDGCTGELVLVTLHQHIVTFFRGSVTQGHLRVNIVDQGSTLTHETSGLVQKLRGPQNEGANGDFSSDVSPGEFNFVLNQSFISPGAPTEHVRQDVHVTISASGEVAVDRTRIEMPPCGQ